jgi:hypothetical protein
MEADISYEMWFFKIDHIIKFKIIEKMVGQSIFKESLDTKKPKKKSKCYYCRFFNNQLDTYEKKIYIYIQMNVSNVHIHI